jgi:hypothetical protein
LPVSEPAVPAGRTPRWDHTIDRRLVHRDAIAEVLLTDLLRTGETEFLLGAQWSRSHRVYRPDHNGRHDPMLILESIRQAGLAVSHVGFGVGFDQQSLMREVSFTLDPRTEPRGLLRSTDVAITVGCRDLVVRAGELRGMTLDLSFAADGLPFATGCGTVRWLPAPRYAALRDRGGDRLDWDQLRWSTTLPPRAPSALRDTADVLLAAEPGPGLRRRLVTPLDHPVYFDHALDHAPGMLLMDAAWQAVHDYRGDRARLISAELDFPTFTELGVDTYVLLTPVSEDTTEFVIRQAGRHTASGYVRVGPPPPQ